MSEKDEIKKKYLLLKNKIEKIGFISTGSITQVYNTCGRSQCECYKDRSRRHGPYNVWTRKVRAKTVTRNLTDKQAKFARECINNMREIEKIIEQMKDLSVQYIEGYGNNFKVDKNRKKL